LFFPPKYLKALYVLCNIISPIKPSSEMKKNVLIIASVAMLGFTLWSCQKENKLQRPDSVQHRITSTHSVNLSAQILELDSIRQHRKHIVWTENDTRKLVKVAMADMSSAWAAFKIVGKLLTPGYGAAAALLAGIGGSLYAWWLEGGFNIAQTGPNPNTNTTLDPTDPRFVGQAHNKLVHQGMQIPGAETQNLSDFTDATYDAFVEKTADITGTSMESLLENMPKELYQQIVGDQVQPATSEEMYASAISAGVSEHAAGYMFEFHSRVQSPSLTYEDGLAYSDLFIQHIGSLSAFTETERHNLIAIISVFKNSLQYWNYALEHK
jgi:hypothetical protein